MVVHLPDVFWVFMLYVYTSQSVSPMVVHLPDVFWVFMLYVSLVSQGLSLLYRE